MAHPLFMICSECGVIDRKSNAISAFNIIEAMHVYEGDAPPPDELSGGLPFLRLYLISAWVSDEGDGGRDCDFEWRLRFPGKDEFQTIHTGSFRWTTKNQRLITDLRLPPKLSGGVLLIVNAIREAGSDSDWQTQQYEIQVEHTSVTSSTG